jgi:hypothetical protein
MDSETYQWHPTLEQNCMGIEAKSVTGKLTYRHSVLLEKAFVEYATYFHQSRVARIEKINWLLQKMTKVEILFSS